MTRHSEIPAVLHGAEEIDAKLAVYGVHGRTQSPEFLQELDSRLRLGDIRWTLPVASENSWYPGKFMEDKRNNQPQLDDALSVVEAQVGSLLRARDAGGPPVVVLGFSQGACLLAEYLLTRQPPVDGVVLHTGGYLGPYRRSFPDTGDGSLSRISVELFCADEDPWVPLHRAKETAEAFEQLTASSALTVYRESEHHINDDALQRIRAYLTRRW